MYPQTHVYFAQRVLRKSSDQVTLGSIFPDLVISSNLNHRTAHYSGKQIFKLCKSNDLFFDFARAVITHGIEPRGLDYYGDEKFSNFERGYCFEKGRIFIDETVRACNIPSYMGWWKAHNIIEMGIELKISSRGNFGTALRKAFNNYILNNSIEQQLIDFHPRLNLLPKVIFFAEYIEIDNINPETLAAKYNTQMLTKHNVSINQTHVSRLIEKAARLVEKDMDEFFNMTEKTVRQNLASLEK